MRNTAEPEVIGALIVEQIRDRRPREDLEERVQLVCRHASLALSNALEHDGLFLMPVWRALGKARWIVQARTLPKTVSWLAAAAALIGLFLFVPAELTVKARGTLDPRMRRHVYATEGGLVDNVLVQHGQFVAANEPLLEIRAQESLGGEQRDDGGDGISFPAVNRPEQIVSPIAGQVITWNVEQILLSKPVRAGELLMTVADPNGPWELELYIPEDQMGKLSVAQRHQPDQLDVRFLIATQPGVRHQAVLSRIDPVAQDYPGFGRSVRVIADVDASLPEARPGASVTAAVCCGRRSLGYVWFHQVVEFVQSRMAL